MKWETCNDGNCKCGLIWDSEMDVPVLQVLTKNDIEVTLGYGLIPGSDKFKEVYRLAAKAPELLEIAEEMIKLVDYRNFHNHFSGGSNEFNKMKNKWEEIINKAKGVDQ